MSVVGNLSHSAASKYAERVASDIDMLETNRWIDAGTALVYIPSLFLFLAFCLPLMALTLYWILQRQQMCRSFSFSRLFSL